MKRPIVITAALCLLVGAVVNVLVAWGCAIWAPADNVSSIWSMWGSGWPAPPPAGWPKPTYFAYWHGIGVAGESASAGVEEFARTKRQDPNVTWRMMVVARYGLPLPSMQSANATTFVMRTITRVRLGPIEEGVRLPTFLQPANTPDRFLPFDPLLAGFAVNSLCFGGVAWVLYAGCGAVRRYSRRRRGLCARCAYPIGVSAVCTECGALVRPRGTAKPAAPPPIPAAAMAEGKPLTRRIVTTGAVFLLVGAAVNVLVAWGCAVGAGQPQVPPRPGSRLGGQWQYEVPNDWPSEPEITWLYYGRGIRIEFAEANMAPSGTVAYERSFRCGWPLPALIAVRYWAGMEYGRMSDWVPGLVPGWHDGLRVPLLGAWRTFEPDRALPIVPLWPGFVADTLLFGGAAFGLVFGPGALRRSLRRRRGSCIRCGYDLRGLREAAVCPECGRAAGVVVTMARMSGEAAASPDTPTAEGES